jgi:hypothetical protein
LIQGILKIVKKQKKSRLTTIEVFQLMNDLLNSLARIRQKQKELTAKIEINRVTSLGAKTRLLPQPSIRAVGKL